MSTFILSTAIKYNSHVPVLYLSACMFCYFILNPIQERDTIQLSYSNSYKQLLEIFYEVYYYLVQHDAFLKIEPVILAPPKNTFYILGGKKKEKRGGLQRD